MHRNDYTPADTLITDFCDSDANWGPLLFLRPARSERLTDVRCFAVSFLPGVAFGLLGSFITRALGVLLERPTGSPLAFPLVLTVFYFLACRVVLAPAWNRRAELLSNGRA
jgi:hypothetical protein